MAKRASKNLSLKKSSEREIMGISNSHYGFIAFSIDEMRKMLSRKKYLPFHFSIWITIFDRILFIPFGFTKGKQKRKGSMVPKRLGWVISSEEGFSTLLFLVVEK